VIEARRRGLLLKGGGHTMAAGLTVEAARLDAFADFVRDRHGAATGRTTVEPEPLELDGALSVAALRPELARELERMAPFGSGSRAFSRALPRPTRAGSAPRCAARAVRRPARAAGSRPAPARPQGARSLMSAPCADRGRWRRPRPRRRARRTRPPARRSVARACSGVGFARRCACVVGLPRLQAEIGSGSGRARQLLTSGLGRDRARGHGYRRPPV